MRSLLLQSIATSRFIFLSFLQINLNYFQFKDDELMLQIFVSCHDHSPELQTPGFWLPADCYTNVLQRCPILNCPPTSLGLLLLLWCPLVPQRQCHPLRHLPYRLLLFPPLLPLRPPIGQSGANLPTQLLESSLPLQLSHL